MKNEIPLSFCAAAGGQDRSKLDNRKDENWRFWGEGGINGSLGLEALASA
jgi:hypothetical protein